CLYEGVEHLHGHTFQSLSNPCERCTCVRGTVSCVSPNCPSAPCDNPVIQPGRCCPECTGDFRSCYLKQNTLSWFADSTPCMTCTCVNGVTTCSEVRCASPCANLRTVPGECCPVCAGEIELERCDSLRYCGNTESVFITKDLTWTCLQQTCPELSCPHNEQHSPPDSCCPVCNDSKESCLYQGTVYHSDEQWELDECTSCTCVSGDVHCRSERCPPLTCAACLKVPEAAAKSCVAILTCQLVVILCTCTGKTNCYCRNMPAVIPGLCCPHCLSRPATCTAFGDPHYRTFDGRMFHFQGTCTYILAMDCKGEDFRVLVTNDDRGRKGVSWTKEVTVLIGDVAVQLLQEFVVKVCVFKELKMNLNGLVLWSPRSHLEVSVPGSYRGHTCGLCGNFNKYPQDDLQMSTGQLTQSESEFEQTDKGLSCKNVDPCKSAGYQARKGANARCKVLKSAAFKPCHRVVPPEPWYGACVYDLCACGANSDECLCDTLEAYASQCREAGVNLQWRSTSLSVGCPVERGFVFDECGPPCPVTCYNAHVPLGVIESHCFKPCVPGCQCPAGLVLHDHYCIQPEKCPKVIHDSAS
uniref:BMP binding endothelial regulator n=1 Tax=Fundulus heteroclitus TaxID=8078 RepID=A0A3Q2NUD7_FUNHE